MVFYFYLPSVLLDACLTSVTIPLWLALRGPPPRGNFPPEGGGRGGPEGADFTDVESRGRGRGGGGGGGGGGRTPRASHSTRNGRRSADRGSRTLGSGVGEGGGRGGAPAPSWNDLAAMGGPGTAPVLSAAARAQGQARAQSQQPPPLTLKEMPPQDPLGEVLKSPEEHTLCVVCVSAAREVVFTPCGHLVMCASCGGKCDTCPICRTSGSVIRVHIS